MNWLWNFGTFYQILFGSIITNTKRIWSRTVTNTIEEKHNLQNKKEKLFNTLFRPEKGHILK